jgi:GNAT superfamily N-acetyltransferase
MQSEAATQQIESRYLDTFFRIKILERMEMTVMREFLAVSPKELIDKNNLKLYESGDGVGALLFFNRWTRLGLDRPATPEALARVRAWIRVNSDAQCSIDLSPLAAPDELVDWLAQSGMVDSGARIVTLWQGAHAEIQNVPCEYEVREVGAEAAAHFAAIHRLAKSGWSDLAPVTSGLVGRAHWRSYAVYDQKIPIACAAMFTEGEVSWRGIAATLPDYRGRGAHSALVARMTQDALAAGSLLIMAQTYRTTPVRAAPSERNLMRAGFSLSHVRPQYVKRTF